jgi:hypothetical protein
MTVALQPGTGPVAADAYLPVQVEGALTATSGYLVPTGIDDDLDEAMRACVRKADSHV